MIKTFSLVKKQPLLKPEERRNDYLRVFLLAMAAATLIFLPSVIYYGGHFYFSGDFNVQQVPFYQMAWREVHNGNLFWTWTTDLGTNFIASYSFYIVGSPFFWFSLLLPYEWLPYMMAPLLVLKISFAALTSFTYIRRFCRNQDFAVLGALLYAFSGWSIYNIFFNHFHEPLVFFPLLLTGLEKLVVDGKKGRFAFAVAINAIVSYFFFAGQVVFVILYFFIRFWDKSWRMTFRRFLAVAFEALFGTLTAAAILVPSVIAVLANPRTTSYSTGFNLLFYDRIQRYGYILQSMFFPPELPARLNFFPDSGSRWTSLSAWLPFVSMTGVIAFISTRQKHWIKRLLITCFVMALVPCLNSLFYMMNSSYYARWFYMGILIMCLATAKALSEEGTDIRRGMRWTLTVTLIFTVCIGLFPQRDGDSIKLGLYTNAERFWGDVIIALYCVLMFYIVWKNYAKKPQYAKMLTIGVLVTAVISGVFFLLSGTTSQEEGTFISTTSRSSAGEMNLDTSEFWRMDVDGDTMDNQGMFWGIPNIQCFQSTVNASIMEFYPTVGVSRDVASRPDQEFYALRGLLSVKYLLISEENATREENPVVCSMPGFEYRDVQNQFCIYENKYFVPMGFAYDYYLTREQYDSLPERQRARALMKTIVLDEEQAARYSDVLLPVENPFDLALGSDSYEADCDARRAESCYAFEPDTNGFTARCNMANDELVFFSVPYEENAWTATVNGESVPVEKVSVGFIAVRVPAGECEIRMDYRTPGLRFGVCVSLVSLAAILVYMAVNRWLDRRRIPVAVSVPGQASSGSEQISDPAEEAGPGTAALSPDAAPQDGVNPPASSPDGAEDSSVGSSDSGTSQASSDREV